MSKFFETLMWLQFSVLFFGTRGHQLMYNPEMTESQAFLHYAPMYGVAVVLVLVFGSLAVWFAEVE